MSLSKRKHFRDTHDTVVGLVLAGALVKLYKRTNKNPISWWHGVMVARNVVVINPTLYQCSIHLNPFRSRFDSGCRQFFSFLNCGPINAGKGMMHANDGQSGSSKGKLLTYYREWTI